jgi:hypothetical protein
MAIDVTDVMGDTVSPRAAGSDTRASKTTHAYIEIDLQMKRTALDACRPPDLDSPPPTWASPDLLTWLEAW